MTSPWSISWTCTLPLPLLLHGLAPISTTSGLPADFDDNRNRHRWGAFLREDPSTSWRLWYTVSRSSSSCLLLSLCPGLLCQACPLSLMLLLFPPGLLCSQPGLLCLSLLPFHLHNLCIKGLTCPAPVQLA